MKISILIIVSIVAVFLTGCSKSDNLESGNAEGSFSADYAKTDGKWKSPECKSYNNMHIDQSYRNSLTFERSSMVIESQTFLGTTCSGSLSSSMKVNAIIDIHSKSSDASTWNTDIIMKKVSMTYYDQDTVNSANTIAYCGFTDWLVNAEKDITGLSCLTTTVPFGNTIYTILKITEDSLQLGEKDQINTGTSEALRHKNLSPAVFNKVNN